MKIRNGFVSNSSSSSFVIVGAVFEETIENCKNICEKYLGEVRDITPYSEYICCDKIIKDNFCSKCGKKKDDINPTINWIDLFNDFKYDLIGIDVINDDGEIIIGKRLGIDLEGDCVPVDKLIKELTETKNMVEELGLKAEFHCGITY